MNIKSIDGPLLKKMIVFAAKNLENNKAIVNELNVFPVPDGDTGTNMAFTIQFAAKELTKLNSKNLSKIADTASSGSLMGARGNSGVILSQLFRGFAKACKGKNVLNSKDLAEALQSGADMAYKAVMKPTEGTILTIARECAQCAIQSSQINPNISIDKFLRNIINHGNQVLDKTPEMLPVLKEANVVDAGGKGLIYILEGAYRSIFEEEITLKEKTGEDNHRYMKTKDNISTADIKFTYCTEFMISSQSAALEKIKNYLSTMGDSLVVVGDEDRVKIHVHTNNPGEIIEYALKIGELTNIKIDNMKEQHRHQLNVDYDNMIEKTEEIILEEKDYGFITVATGEGIADVFKDLGVDSIIEGGQTMNPSTEDFLREINKLNAKDIFILPNNSNILLAANQAKDISSKSVHVLPTKTIPQGISALLAYNPEKYQNENFDEMKEAIGEVKSGQVTFAVRDSQIKGLKIKKDDIIGLYEGSIVVVGRDINEVTVDLINKMIDEDDELITLFSNKETSNKYIDEIQSILEKKFSSVDIETHYGGQLLYYYIIAIE